MNLIIRQLECWEENMTTVLNSIWLYRFHDILFIRAHGKIDLLKNSVYTFLLISDAYSNDFKCSDAMAILQALIVLISLPAHNVIKI